MSQAKDVNSKDKSEQKECFIITPMSGENSEIRRKAQGVIDAVIKPVLKELSIIPISPFDMASPGSITNQVITHLLKADLVVANLTGLNPNVMYELAVRHAKRLPVVCLIEQGTVLPFDLQSERTIYYYDDMYDVEVLKPRLKTAITNSLDNSIVDNPIYRVVDYLLIQSSALPDSERFIIERLNDLSSQISSIRMSRHVPGSNISQYGIKWGLTVMVSGGESLNEVAKEIVDKLPGIYLSGQLNPQGFAHFTFVSDTEMRMVAQFLQENGYTFQFDPGL